MYDKIHYKLKKKKNKDDKLHEDRDHGCRGD